MDRREFMKLAAWAGLTMGLPGLPIPARAAGRNYEGPFWVTIHAGGGWDPTLLCDPKGRTSEDQPNPVNRYMVDEIQEIGPFRVAPIQGHAAFFERFQNQLLVINGIDVGTNSHDVGTRNIWSGSIDPGTPAFSALVAGARDTKPGLSFLSNGGYAETDGIVAPTRIPNTSAITELAYPDRLTGSNPDSTLYTEATWARLNQARAARLERQIGRAKLPRVEKAMDLLREARAGDNELARMTEYLPEALDNSGNQLIRQAQVAIAAFRAGLSVSSNLTVGGFDTHGNHDNQHTPRLQQILAGVTYIVDEAERYGMADKLIILVGSDFARTPYYNENNGKDHWSITSMMMMGAGIPGGRLIGGTNEIQSPLTVNPNTLALSEAGIRITPGHIHAALRNLAGIAAHPAVQKHNVGESLPLFET